MGKLLPRQNCLNSIYEKSKKLLSKVNKSSFLDTFKTLQLSIIKEKLNKQLMDTFHLVGMEESAGAVIWRCSVNKVSWKIAENSQKNTCTGVSF